jgi:hypothetical protein
MRKLTPEGEKAVADIASRHGVSADAVATLLEAVANGGGMMAQFNHTELGGGGQWLRGGMTMVGDMFNSSLKAKVDAICSELSDRLASGEMTAQASSSQSQSQGSGPASTSGASGSVSFFARDAASGSSHWWPAELGNPAATGAQNTVRYAFFPEKGRLAIDNNGSIEIYDTLDHLISGFGQQQGHDASLTFSSQHGPIRIDSLPRVGAAAPAEEPQPAKGDSDAVFAALERLGGLREKGILSEEEFAAKKAELLKRL